MSKPSRLARVAGESLAAFLLVGLMAISAGCGGGDDDPVAAAPPAPPPADPIEGIATPSSVAVVTATNAE